MMLRNKSELRESAVWAALGEASFPAVLSTPNEEV